MGPGVRLQILHETLEKDTHAVELVQRHQLSCWQKKPCIAILAWGGLEYPPATTFFELYWKTCKDDILHQFRQVDYYVYSYWVLFHPPCRATLHVETQSTKPKPFLNPKLLKKYILTLMQTPEFEKSYPLHTLTKIYSGIHETRVCVDLGPLKVCTLNPKP